MTKRFKIEPDFTCPELAGYKLPPCSRSQEDGVEAIVKNLMGLPDYLNLESMSPSMKGSFDFGVQCYNKAREKYEFSREDLVHAIDLAQEVHKPKYCHHYEHTYTPEQIMSILLTPIAIEVEMVQKSINGSIPVGQDWERVPATNPDGTLKGRYIYE